MCSALSRYTGRGFVAFSRSVTGSAPEAERGYDLTKAKCVRMGRPALGDGGVSPRVLVRVDPDLAKALRARARKELRSVSEITRVALRRGLQLSRRG